jgi:hypothetical protein
MPAMHFPVLSDSVERGRQLCFSAYLIAGGLYTTFGMVSDFSGGDGDPLP